MAVNPFPDYPVSRLDSALGSFVTVPTEAIEMARERIKSWVEGLSADGPRPLVVPVRGDYGSGKTHLLVYAASQLNEMLGIKKKSLSLLRLASIEDDPIGWYRSVIGPRLGTLQLDDLVLEVYADSARAIAARANLTQAAVAKLSAEPSYARTLIKENLISSTAVDEEFRAELKRLCPRATDPIRHALSMLVWQDTHDIAMAWLEGRDVSPLAHPETSAAVPTFLVKPLWTDGEVAAVLESVAALHRWAKRPFGVFIDELEHFARPDSQPGRRGNMTWLKRLVEGLGTQGAIVFIAGHWSAWLTQTDVLQRFSGAIDLRTLTGSDVQIIVRAFSPGAEIDPNIAEDVAEASHGNTREAFSILRVLFSNTDGFARDVTADDINEARVLVDRRLSPESSLLAVHQVLEKLGLTVMRDAAVPPGIPFDLVASRAGRPIIVVAQKVSAHEIAALDQLSRFIGQVREVEPAHAPFVGCFLSDGSADPAVSDLLKSESAGNILWLDATEPDFAVGLDRRLRQFLGVPGGDVVAEAADTPQPPSGRSTDLSTLVSELDALNAQRQRELVGLLREVTVQASVNTEREAGFLRVKPDDYRERLTVLYEQLTAKPTFPARLAHMLHLRPLVAIGLMFTGLIGTIVAPSIFWELSGLVFGFCALVALIGFLFALRYFVQIERFYQHRNTALRRTYLMTDNADELLDVHERMTRIFEHEGPHLGRDLLSDASFYLERGPQRPW